MLVWISVLFILASLLSLFIHSRDEVVMSLGLDSLEKETVSLVSSFSPLKDVLSGEPMIWFLIEILKFGISMGMRMVCTTLVRTSPFALIVGIVLVCFLMGILTAFLLVTRFQSWDSGLVFGQREVVRFVVGTLFELSSFLVVLMYRTSGPYKVNAC